MCSSKVRVVARGQTPVFEPDPRQAPVSEKINDRLHILIEHHDRFTLKK